MLDRIELQTVQSAFHLAVLAGVLFSFLQAPFGHVHESDPLHEHAHGFAHMHLMGRIPDGLTIEAEDHDSDARLIDWFAGDGTSPAKFAVALPESIVEPTFSIRFARIPELQTRNHDPPALQPFVPRGPPV